MQEANKLEDELLQECALSTFKGGEVKLQIRSKPQICIVNTGTVEASAGAHTWLCGLPRGHFKLFKEATKLNSYLTYLFYMFLWINVILICFLIYPMADDVDNTTVIFHLANSSDLVVLNGLVLSVGQVIHEKQKTEAAVKIACNNRNGLHSYFR